MHGSCSEPPPLVCLAPSASAQQRQAPALPGPWLLEEALLIVSQCTIVVVIKCVIAIAHLRVPLPSVRNVWRRSECLVSELVVGTAHRTDRQESALL